MPARLHLGIVTPAGRSANNGNWQTASRWARLLSAHHAVSVVEAWQGEPFDALLALHARRSAPSIAAWKAAARGPLAVVLTGTDLYQDIDNDPSARASLEHADRLIVLQELGAERLPPGLRPRVRVCCQSCQARQTLPKTARHLRALMVGHLREVKSPETYFEAAERLRGRSDIRFDHIGAALDPALGARAQALSASHPRYRWLGALDHATTRRHIQRAHVLVHASRLEGGAHVVSEALRSGTPVIASRIDGNVGLLGRDYAGYFEWGDAAALTALLQRARDDAAMLPALLRQCRERAGRFAPEHERAMLLRLLQELFSAGDVAAERASSTSPNPRSPP